ncbi:ferritin-like domain-containing protein [Fibrella forsythiae]|uniref:Ferritin-like domain-containing protein n=1 Tax=Fibrella forsythiae TaxID=2817061 RepID=A0ABS3JFW9_9BACT|nr:ferritin-like domain-containing protein [Fibrella forsythiae]MBO0948331.1 ferritin-like domain-containing protein [Fibrella forsythiae]
MEELNTLPESPTRVEGVGRRSFLRYVGGAAVVGGILSSCTPTDEVAVSSTPEYNLSKYARKMSNGITVDLGTGEVAILNYAYALEQLEAAYYEMLLANPYSEMTAMERTMFTDIRDHEVIHREFFKKALGSAAIPGLTPNFSGINFKQRSVVIDVARQFEDTGVSAYNGAGKYLKTGAYLLTAGKIVSVEARHAALLSDLQFPLSGSFAGDLPVDTMGLERSREPGAVLAIVAPFIQETITFTLA